MSKIKFKVVKKELTVNKAPIGLLLLNNGTIICKSEYSSDKGPICTILSSGETYFGGDANCKSLELIPIEEKIILSMDLNIGKKVKKSSIPAPPSAPFDRMLIEGEKPVKPRK